MIPSTIAFEVLTPYAATSQIAPLLYAIIDPNATYWTYSFFGMIMCVLGTDITFGTATVYIASVARPGEQALAGGVFSTVREIGSIFAITISSLSPTSFTSVVRD